MAKKSSEKSTWNDVKQVGRLTFNRSDLIGKGCNGTNVFKGKFRETESQPEIDVAVKRILFERTKEIEKVFMETVKPHPNVLQHYCTEEDDDFIYIATELCAGTLDDIIKGIYKGPSVGSLREMMRQIALGLHHLHKHNIVHRDIKPTNILVSFPDTENNNRLPRMKLADFGLCRIVKTDGSQSSLTKCGTKGWKAPELLNKVPSIREENAMFAVDIFSLGCVFAYSLSKGNQHPFGTENQRDHRMQNNEDMILSVDDFDPYGQTLFSLIQSMLTYNSMNRISIQDVIRHSYFQ